MSDSAKEFRKRLAAIGASMVAGMGGLAGAACSNENNKENNSSTNIVFKDNQLDFYNEDEIYVAYRYVKQNLKDTENLSKQEIIELSNIYKKVICSIDYIDSQNKGTYVVDKLPRMDGLYTDIKNELVDLISDKSLLLMPNDALEYQVRELSEQYLISTDEIPLEDVKIAQVDDRYCVVSNDNEIFFEVYMSTGEEDTLYISPESNLTNIDKISSKAVSIIETDSKIPVINSKDLEEDFER